MFIKSGTTGESEVGEISEMKIKKKQNSKINMQKYKTDTKYNFCYHIQ